MSSTDHSDGLDPRSPEALSAYFDGELDAAARAEVEQWLAEDPGAKTQLDALDRLHFGVIGAHDAHAAAVPQARFEQVWDAIERDTRAETSEAAGSSNVVQGFFGRFGPARWPLAAVGVAALALWIVRPSSPDAVVAKSEPAPAPQIPAPAPVPSPSPSPSPSPAPNALAAAEVHNDADIQRIEFGGRSGRIQQIEGQRGTTTVIWVTEEEPTTKEREL